MNLNSVILGLIQSYTLYIIIHVTSESAEQLFVFISIEGISSFKFYIFTNY